MPGCSRNKSGRTALRRKHKFQKRKKTALNFSRSNRGLALAFLSILVATSGAMSGCIGISSSAANSNPTPQPAVLNLTPSTVSVATVVGNTGTQTITATNPGQSSVAINQISVSGAGFSSAGLAFPANLAPGASKSFAVTFQATTPGTAVGSLSIMTSASTSPVVVQLSATATSSGSTPPTRFRGHLGQCQPHLG